MAEDVTADENLGRPVRIMWIDSGMSDVSMWTSREEFEKLTDSMAEPVETVGLWMGENERVVIIGQSRDKDGDNWHSAQLIWKPNIVKREWLE